jgi:hypothetical protein
MEEYRFKRRSPVCMESGEPFREGDTIVSAIHASPEGFVRRDVRADRFAGATEAFSVWKSRMPATEEEEKRLDLDLALDFLARLLREADPAREGLAYVLTLLLARKRRVKIRETRAVADGEILTVALPRPDGEETVKVRAPPLDDAEVASLQQELAKLFGVAAPPDSRRDAENAER